MYWDANNLYGGAMCEYLPYKNLRIDNDVSLEVVLNTSDDDDVGYIIECDLHVPQEIYAKLKEFPPCPETMSITEAMLSPYQKQLAKKNNVKIGGCSKLVPHLMDKVKYCIHYKNLKFIKGLGIKTGPVHNVVSFTQKPFLK